MLLLCVLLNTSGRCKVATVGDVSSSMHITTYQSLRIQLVQNVPDHGPMRSGTFRANINVDKTYSLEHFVYLVGLHIYYKMVHGPYNNKLGPILFAVVLWGREKSLKALQDSQFVA